MGVGGASLSGGVLGAFFLRGAGWDFPAAEGRVSKPVEAFEMSFTKLSPLQKNAENDSDSLQED